ncbi:hypothetical protein BJF85_23285 [Saccharomonospora sp. CUA-673]|uniref:hypothetical protein n=1 Tax=Saccharomonospora sp. CUA-673 TaxID=1904969 RepID=UPI0009662EB5|nr:hypothetical protein [Saccharomonospora sp. CUA-673]OLT42149.1 hypothetical protein BJF85_23285 [Saccharomonospora sp. CUA-673]
MFAKTALTVASAALIAGVSAGTAAATPEPQSTTAGDTAAAQCMARWHGESSNLHQRVHLTVTGCGNVDGVLARMDLSNGMSTDCKPMNADGYVFFDVPSFVDATAMHWC